MSNDPKDIPVVSSALLDDITFAYVALVCWSICLLMLLVLLYCQIRVIYEWNRKYREYRRKNHQPNGKSPDAFMDAFLSVGICGCDLGEFGEKKTSGVKHFPIWCPIRIGFRYAFDVFKRVMNVCFRRFFFHRCLSPNDKLSDRKDDQRSGEKDQPGSL